jgi:peptide/nickel transport system permease protein
MTDSKTKSRSVPDVTQYADTPSESDWQITWRQFKKNNVGMAGLVAVYLLFAVAVLAPVLANGLPFYMQGVVTVFYDSDVAAWRDLNNKVVPRYIRLLNSKRIKLTREQNQLAKYKLRLSKQQIEDVFDRVQDYLPPEDISTLNKLVKAEYLPLLNKSVKDFDLVRFEQKGSKIDDWLSSLSFIQSYKRANSLREEASPALSKLEESQEEYVDAVDDEDEPFMASLSAKYSENMKKIARLETSLNANYTAMASFLPADKSKKLDELKDTALRALNKIPEKIPEEGDDMLDAVQVFRESMEGIDAFAEGRIPAKSQRIPRRTFYPAFQYMVGGEVFFIILFLAVTLVIVLAKTDTFTPNSRSIWWVTLAPAIFCALAWHSYNPPRNPPPVSYYKSFYRSLKAQELKADEARSMGQEVTSPGHMILALVPFGENENISIDSKVPPSWSESYSKSRKRLLTDKEKKLDRLRFATPANWLLLTSKEKKAQKIPKLLGAASFQLQGRGDDNPLAVRSFSLKDQPFQGQFAKTKAAWLTLTKKAASAERFHRRIPTIFCAATAVVWREGDQSKAVILLDWKGDSGPRDAPWAIEIEGPSATLDAWWPSVEIYVGSATSNLRALVSSRLKDPVRYHWLGTDENGRDVCARMIYGSRVSLSVGFIAVAIYVFIGVFLGSIAGYFGGWTDILISRIIEVVICFPSFFLIITVLAMLPPSIVNIMVVIGLTRWTGVARLIRGEFLRLVNLDFVVACRALGFSPLRTIFRHIVPNALAPVLVAATFGVAGAILTESALSYLGFGVPQPQASWGSILQEASDDPKQLWWITVFPGLAIFITITAYNIVGEAFRDASDPKLRK